MGERPNGSNGARKPNGKGNGKSFLGDTTNTKRVEAESALCRHFIANGAKPIDAIRRLAEIIAPGP
jgi:hypothetical protein